MDLRGNSEQAAAGSCCQDQQRGNDKQQQARNHAWNARNTRQLGNEKDGGKTPE